MERLDLAQEAPTAVGCEACRVRFVERLQQVTGIRAVRSSVTSLEVETDGSNVHWRIQAKRIAEGLSDGLSHAQLRLGGMDCPGCAEQISAGVGSLRGVSYANASFIHQRLDIEFDSRMVTQDEVAGEVKKLGFGASTLASPRRVPSLLRLSLSGLLFLTGALVAGRNGAILYATVALIEAWPILIGAVGSLRRRTVTMNVLMSIALIGAAALGEWGEAAAVAWLAALGRAIQDWAGGRTRAALDELIRLAPETARLADGTQIATAEVRSGQEIVVHAADRVPLDGEVVSGLSDVDESAMTGESLPVSKEVGSRVLAGSVNLSGTLRIRVTNSAGDSTLARMVRAIEVAQERRAPVQATIDRFAAFYTPIVILLAVGVGVLPPLLGAPWQPWIERSLWLLVVACPCALVLSTPVAVVSAIGAASRYGAIIKGGLALESLAEVRTIVFDKTGTLTGAELRVTRIEGEPQTLALAAALESQSSHPVAKGIRAASPQSQEATGIRTIPGRGLEGQVGGQTVRVGSPDWIGIAAPVTEGEIAVAVESDGKHIGTIHLSDYLRRESHAVISDLRALGITKQIMLSGDKDATVQRVGASLGIEAIGSLLPDQKAMELQKLHGPVLMVGDGINDLAAMSEADVSMAMGAAGTQAAMENADIVLMNDRLETVPILINLARNARSVMRENIGVSVLVKIGLVIAAIPAPLPLWLAVVGDVGVSALVTLNATRLLWRRPNCSDACSPATHRVA